MKILIFTAKSIGLCLTNFLLINYPEDNYEIVVCGPDGNEICSKLKNKCENVNALSPEVLKTLEEREDQCFDWLLNLWGSHIFNSKILSKAKDSVNIHPSYLPFGRGSDPVVWALRHDLPAGATLHRITEEIDSGEVWCQEIVEYDFKCTGGKIYEKVILTCKNLFFFNWENIREHKIFPKSITSADFPVKKRRQLLEDRVIELKNDTAEYSFIRKVLANDFGEKYSAELVYNKKSYAIRIYLEEIKTED